MGFFDGKAVLITGVCGTVGAMLCRRLLSGELGQARQLMGIDNNESGLFLLQEQYRGTPNATFLFRDLRDAGGLPSVVQGIDIVLHTAALKHVGICERSPFESVRTNILGLANLLDVCQSENVRRFIFTSTDKAVNPTNVMGTSKLMGERLVTAANAHNGSQGGVYASTRFGNVLGSRGSVIPLFKNQIRSGCNVTLTDRDMTRFIMTMAQAADLVLRSAELALGGEVFITKMPVIRIADLARVLIDERNTWCGLDTKAVEIEEIGIKPGEKLYEELMSSEETRRAVELTDFFVVLPAFRGVYSDIEYSYPDTVTTKVENAYNSAEQAMMSCNELRDYLACNDLLTGTGGDTVEAEQTSRLWPGEENIKGT